MEAQQPQQTGQPVFHTHNGVDAPRINPKYLLGFTVILVGTAATAPTDSASNGTLRFFYDSGSHYMGWVRINNQWKSFTLS